MSDLRLALMSAQISEGHMDKMLAWHFLADDGRMKFGRRPAVEVGKVYNLAKNQRPELCARGFHGSVRAIDALRYAPGALVCRVNIWGEVQMGDDKLVGRHREVLWMADATEALHEFSAWAAEWILDTREARGYKIDPRSRAAIEAKRRWLRGEISDAELAAARDAARDAAWAAARDAPRDAARAAAWAAAWDAAAGAAARDAAWDAARDAAWAAAWDAARAAAWAAAWDAAWAAAWDAARDAALAHLNGELERRLLELEPKAEVA